MRSFKKIKNHYWNLPRNYFFLSNLFLARLIHRPVILAFHRVNQSTEGLLDERVGTTDSYIFDGSIKYLKMLGYKAVPLKHLVNSILETKLEKLAAITFDDGFKDLFNDAYPILAKYHLPFTLFLITSTVNSNRLLWLHKIYKSIDHLSDKERRNIINKYIHTKNDNDGFGKIITQTISSSTKENLQRLASNLAIEVNMSEEDERLHAEMLYLTKNELMAMQQKGLSIESHGHYHWHCGILNRHETEQEVRASLEFIEREFGVRPSFYGLPYGMGNRFIKETVRNFGLTGMATSEPRLLRPHQDPYNIPRIFVSNDSEFFYKQLHREYINALCRP